MLSKVVRAANVSTANIEPYVFQPAINGRPQVRRNNASPGRRSGDDRQDTGADSGPLHEKIAALELQLTQQAATIRQAALKEGETMGLARAQAALKPVVENLGRTVQQVLDTKPALRKEVEEEAVQLSLAIARRILRRELSVDPSALHGLVQAAFERVARLETTRVVVHPDHAVQVRAALAAATTRNIEVVADGARESGTLIFETTRGAVDASLDSQLKEIELGLADRLKWN
jgi:flagellar assembly protein FliH